MQPISLQIIAWAGSLVMIAFLAFIIFGSYTHRIRLSGETAPSQGILRIFAPKDGRVTTVPVAENTHVKQGDLLFILDTGARSPTAKRGRN